VSQNKTLDKTQITSSSTVLLKEKVKYTQEETLQDIPVRRHRSPDFYSKGNL
jgi:hypothetical protein